MEKIRLLIADDHPAFREGLSRLLEEEEDLECVGISADGEEAVRMVEELHPDVAIIDVSMPNLDGIKATEKIKAACPDTAVLMISAFDYQSYVLASLKAGASGYMSKDRPLQELISAIRLVRSGDSILDLKATDTIVQCLIDSERGGKRGFDELQSRELDVIKLTARGMSNKDIADELFISERTVQTHLINIFRKLGVNSRTQAVLYALRKGWITLSAIYLVELITETPAI
ncbi:MAG TPA: response regulator transcription factor [Dehalococcoidales bacterium]|nr:response regulator transcription factor [Dehalococcoidales bacterium]